MNISSEDEAWMKQAAYHFSDSSDEDEGDTAINEVYLQAVQALKQKANSKDKLSTSISDSDPESQLPSIQSEQLPPIRSEPPSSIQRGAEARAKPASAAQASHQPVEACIDKPPQLTTMEVLSLLFPKEQPPIAAAAAAASSTSGVTSDVPVTPAAATVTDTTAALPAIAAAAAAPSAATMPAADSQPAPFLSGHSMLTTVVQQMAEAITSAAVQVVEARRLQKQQHCSVLAAALPGMSLATSLADERQVAQVGSSMAMTATSQPQSSLFTMSAAAGALSTGSFFEQAVSGPATPPEAISVAAASAVASRAAAAAAPAAAVSDMPSSKLKVKKPGIMSGGSTHDAGQAAAPELHKKAPPMKLGPPPPVRMGPPPPVRLGPPPPVRLGPPPTVRLGPPPPVRLGPSPPVRLGPLPPAWPQPLWAPPQPNATAYWSRPAIAPPRPPPGGPLFPPSMPSLASSHVPPLRQSLPVSKKMKRPQARSAQKQAAAVKPAQPAKKVGRGLKRASSIGSVDSNNGDEDERAQPSARKSAFASAGAQAAETGQPAKGRKHEKRLRRCAKQRAKLAESAQQAFTKALVKSVQGAVRKQEDQMQAPKSTAPKRKKTKAEYKAEHIQRLRRGNGHIDISYLK